MRALDTLRRFAAFETYRHAPCVPREADAFGAGADPDPFFLEYGAHLVRYVLVFPLDHGHRDDHLPPGDGNLDWADIAGSLKAIAFSGWIMLELRCPGPSPADDFRRAFAQASRLLG